MRRFNTIDKSEVDAIGRTLDRTLKDGVLSGYIGTKPYGGPECLALEGEWSKTFGSKYSVAVNSATSGLLAACMAIEIQPGDEVIVSPYTMSATAAAPKLLGAKLVFADIEDQTFCMDPAEASLAITSKTKAIIVTNLFGHPARLYDLRRLCDENGIYLIEDNAQGVLAKESIDYAGTVGHIGVFSLNVHKQIQTGEGGVCTTNSSELSRKLREAMNHGEMRGGILGLNLRMTEITASMARAQLPKAAKIIESRKQMAGYITNYVKHFKLPVRPPVVRDNCEHAWYCWAGLLKTLVRREDWTADSPFKLGYVQPLYKMPVFEQDIKLEMVEAMENRIVLVELCAHDLEQEEIAQMVTNLGKIL